MAGDYEREIAALGRATVDNDYYRDVVDKIAQKTPLSTLAIYTRLFRTNRVTATDYDNIYNDIIEDIRRRQELAKAEEDRKRQQAKDEGKPSGGGAAQPIISPLYLNTLRGALYSGLINEGDFCARLGIPVTKMEKYLA